MRPLTANDYLTVDQIAAVVRYCRARRDRSPLTHRAYAVFVLATFCGARAGEILRLRLSDVRLHATEPYLRIASLKTRGAAARKYRDVPLTLVVGVQDDLARWVATRRAESAAPGDPLICLMSRPKRRVGESGTTAPPGSPVTRRAAISAMFRVACRPLWADAVRAEPWNAAAIHAMYHTHRGRHTFGTELARRRYSLPCIQQWLGHTSIDTTMIYVHAVTDHRSADSTGF